MVKIINEQSENDRLRAVNAELNAENDRLLVFARRQQQEIETLLGYADAVEALRDIGKLIGCGHVDDPDGRRQIVSCVEQELDRLESVNAELLDALKECLKRVEYEERNKGRTLLCGTAARAAIAKATNQDAGR